MLKEINFDTTSLKKKSERLKMLSKITCKIEATRGGVKYEWVTGIIEKVYPTYILVKVGPFKECFLIIDQGDTWEVIE